VVRAVPALAIVLLVLPLSCYRSTLAAADVVHRPLQILRDCLSTVAERESAAPWANSGVWLEGRMPSYAYKYYLRRFGPWQQRDAGSDGTVAMNLYSPDSYRLVLLSPDRYAEFLAHMNADRAGLVEQVARKAQIDPGVLSQTMTLANTRVVMLPDDVTPEGVLLLPAPYRACGKAPVERSR
jgi:hypothetical protein